MVNIKKKVDCCGCGACMDACSMKAISMEYDEEGFFYPYIDLKKCINCGKCVRSCPMLNKAKDTEELLCAFACYAKDEKIREKSTSGGVFAVIANFFIKEFHGSVYGVKFDENYKVVYCKANTWEQIECMQGSKYVQADTGNVYEDIKEKLERKEYVLFSGLPCQIEALRSFLNKWYERLYLIDIVCFGISSPQIWSEYIKNFHTQSKLSNFVFKDKKYGWKNWRVKVIEDGKEMYYDRKKNLYMNSYLQRINIRPSCFECKFKGIHRNSDFSISDAWGVAEENKKINDDKGMSALVIHSKKGFEMFIRMQEEFEYQEYNPEQLMNGNWAVQHSPKMNEKREEFFLKYKTENFGKLFKEYFGSIE